MTAPFFTKKDVENKIVVDVSGKSAGTGRDIAFSLDGRLALVVAGKNGKEIQIPMSRVMGVTEYIIISPEEATTKPIQTPHTQPQTQTQAARICANCGTPLKAGARFCEKCGKGPQ